MLSESNHQSINQSAIHAVVSVCLLYHAMQSPSFNAFIITYSVAMRYSHTELCYATVAWSPTSRSDERGDHRTHDQKFAATTPSPRAFDFWWIFSAAK